MSTLDAIFGSEAGKTESGATDRAEQKVEQLLALNKAAIAITGELDLDRLLQRIVDVARDLIGCQYAALGVLGSDGYIERFPTSGISDVDREKIGAPPRGHGLLGVMLRAGRSLRIPDISKDSRRSGFPPNHPPMTSLLGVPIFVRGKLMGDLYLTDKIDAPEFSEEDEWLVQLLATHAATALTNAQLHAENIDALQRASIERARFQGLFTVTQAVNRSVRLEEVIPIILGSAVDLLGAAGAALYLLEQSDEEVALELGNESREPGTERTGVPRFVARHSIGVQNTLTEAQFAQLPLNGSIAGRAVQSGTTQVIRDTRDEKDIVLPRLLDKELRSLVAVPLVTKDRIFGVLSTYSELTNAFNEEAIQLLEAFGAVASTAIFNARLYEEAERGREAAEREGQRLRELEHMKDEFLSTAAHELRTPLTTIRMSAGLAHEQLLSMRESGPTPEEGGIDPRLVNLVALILDGSQRMHSLVNDLLDLTRLEQGRTTLNMEDLDLREVVQTSVEATTPLFRDRNQTLTVHLPELYCGVRGDRQRLEQVVINLLSNASKYSPEGKQIEIRTLRSQDHCFVTVRDQGPGVPEDERELIFGRFYRSSIHRNDRTPSTGLGLAISRQIAEMHKGKVWVEAAPGGGSIFTLMLPTAR